ncbi:extracellular solute-binding protein (family 3) [Paraburkholderia sp. BL18I3N2]|uniref:transporter substrate-binding domain-containing protein n=1 Tax=unclassified Paraburkholderia TaxID=2615204 RepID=UPI000D0594EB|nr:MULTISPECIES: transporter substrate-binding domain-containing protein [unclassified Paraburkholderia]PRX19628.1 extracellular solute-binding protein (family 3) [Paraburkholderia sp. BL18I3N2]PRX95915.1 extracellular solute-binding protein (family 3) [Paraburkholderia sp. BL25I1N1]
MNLGGTGRGTAVRLAVAMALTCDGVSRANAQSIERKVLRDGKITIGIHNQALWGYKNTDGSVAGLGPDIIRAVLGPMGVKQIDFVVVDFDALIPSLLSGRIDAVASGLAITPQRCQQVVFSNPDLAIGDAVLVRKGTLLNVHKFADVAKNPAVCMAGGRGS